MSALLAVLGSLLLVGLPVHAKQPALLTGTEEREIELIERKIERLRELLGQTGDSMQKSGENQFELFLNEHLASIRTKNKEAGAKTSRLDKLSLRLYPVFERKNSLFAGLRHLEFVPIKQYQTKRFRRLPFKLDNFETKVIVCTTADRFLILDYSLEVVHSEALNVEPKFFKNLRARDTGESKPRLTYKKRKF